MNTMTIEREISASPETLFALCSDFPNAASLIPAIKHIEMQSSGPIGVGTQFRETRSMLGREGTQEMKVTAFDPPQSYTLETLAQGLRCTIQFTFAPVEQGTRVTVHFSSRPESIWQKMLSPMSGMIHELVRKGIESDLRHIQRVAEKNSPGKSPRVDTHS